MTHFLHKAVRALVLTGLVTLMLTASAMAAEAQQAIGVGCTTGSSLRLREKPSTSSSIITVLNKGVAVSVLEPEADGWYHIAYNGKSGYVSADYMILDRDNVFETYGRVSSDGVNLRAAASTEGAVVGSLSQGTSVTVTGFDAGWYFITTQDGLQGYIRSDLLDLTSALASSAAASVAESAAAFLGTRYTWGGSSPSGFDCSGFTMYLYKQIGYSLPHSASGQWNSGTGTKVWSIDELQPGDLVFFNDPSRNAGKACSHCGVYTGNGQFIHASSSKNGVIYSSITSGYYYNYFVGGIRV